MAVSNSLGFNKNQWECPVHILRSPCLRRHLQDAHEQYPCPICGEMISKRRAAFHFQSKHTAPEDMKFKCDLCGKGFTSAQKLRNHVNIHTGEKPFKCKFCTSAFADSANHRMHERMHMGYKRTK